MEIVLVTGAFPRYSQPFITAKAVGLARRGHRVTVLASGPGDHPLDLGTVGGLDARLTVEHWRRPRIGPGRPGTGAGAGAAGGQPDGAAGAAAGRPGAAARARRLGAAALSVARAGGRDPRFVGRLGRALRAGHGVGPEFWRRLEAGVPFAGRRADVVHFEWATKAARATELIGLLPAPVVVSCRGTDVELLAPADPRLAAAMGQAFARAAAVHCVSGAVLRAAERLGLDRSRAFVNHPAVDTTWFAPAAPGPAAAPPAGDGLRLLSVGRLHPVKGYPDALAAVRLLVDRGHDVRYTIVGGGDPGDVASLRDAVDELGLGGRVELAGALPPAGVRRHLRDADIFLLASHREGLSNAALEAMATALPVVCTAVGGMPEAVRDGVDGYLVPPRDPGAMAGALARLATDADLRSKMGWHGRQRVCEAFDLAGQLDRFEAVYQALAGGAALGAALVG